MEVLSNPECTQPTSGSFNYIDDYGVRYEVSWQTTASGLDITTIIKQPFVWGETNSGYVVGHALFRRGMVSVQRQIFTDNDDGYTLVSEGSSQTISVYQDSFPCGPAPSDPFCYHLNNCATDDVDCPVITGPHWSDPNDPGDDGGSWGDGTSTWIDIW